MVTNPSSRPVLDEEGMGVVVVNMERAGMLRKDTGVDVVVAVVVEKLKTRMVRKRMALAVPHHKVYLLSFLLFSYNSSCADARAGRCAYGWAVGYVSVTNYRRKKEGKKIDLLVGDGQSHTASSPSVFSLIHHTATTTSTPVSFLSIPALSISPRHAHTLLVQDRRESDLSP